MKLTPDLLTSIAIVLFKSEEQLGGRLAVMHNLYFYNTLTEKIREALDEGRFEQFRNQYSSLLASKCED